MVESVMLDQSYSRVIIKARLNAEMKDVLRKDTVFWVVKPTVGREGVSGWAHCCQGHIFRCSLPIPAANAVNLNCLIHRRWRLRTPKDPRDINQSAGRTTESGDAVLFRGYRVGSVETAEFNLDEREMQYELFINAPYDKLVTTNARFWKDSGIAFDMSSQG